MSAPFGLLSESLVSSSSLMHHLIGDESELRSNLGQESFSNRRMDLGSDSSVRKIRRKKRKNRLSAQTPNDDTVEYKPESLVYICKDDKECPPPAGFDPKKRSPSFKSRVRGIVKKPVTDGSTKALRKKFTYKRLNKTESEEKPGDFGTIFRKDLRSRPFLKKTRFGHNKGHHNDDDAEEPHPEPNDFVDVDEEVEITLKDIEQMPLSEVKEKLEEMAEEMSVDEKKENRMPKAFVEVIVEMMKETGSKLSHQEMEIIKEVTEEMGATVTDQQLKLMSEISKELPMLPTDDKVDIIASAVGNSDDDISDNEIETIAEVIGKMPTEIKPEEAQALVEITSNAIDDKLTKEEPTANAKEVSEMVKKAAENGDVSRSEKAHIEQMTKAMDPELSKDEVKVVTEILNEVGEKVDEEVVEKVAEAVKDTNVDKLEGKVEMLARKAKKLSKEMTKEDMEVVTNMLKQIGPTLSKAESQMIASIAEGSGTSITTNDAKVIFEMMEEVGKDVQEAELEIMATLTKADADPLPKKEAQKVAEVVLETKSLPDVMKKDQIKEVAMKVEPELSDHEAEIMTEILIEVTENVDEEVVQEVSKLVKEASDTLTVELVDTLGTLMDPLTTDVKVEELNVLKEMTEEIKRDPSMNSLNKVSKMLKRKGSEMTMQDIMIVNDIVNVMGPKISETEMGIISVISKKAGDKKPQAITTPKPEEKVSDFMIMEVVEMVKSMGAITEVDKSKIKITLKEMSPKLTHKEVNVMSELVKEVGENLDFEVMKNITQLSVNETLTITPHEIQVVAEQAKNLDKNVTAEEVKFVAEMKEKMGGDVSRSEAHMIARMGRNSGMSLSARDVKVIADIVDTVGPNLSDADAEVVSVLTEASEKEPEVQTPRSVPRRPVVQPAKFDPIKDFGEKVPFSMQDNRPTVDKMETMREVMKAIGESSSEAVKVASEIADAVDSEAEKDKMIEIIEKAKDLENEVSADTVEVIVDVALKMGPAISHREMRLLQSIAKDSGADLSMKDVKALADIMQTVGHDGITREEAKTVAMISEMADKKEEEKSPLQLQLVDDQDDVKMSEKEANTMVHMVRAMGPVITKREEKQLEEIVKATKPELSDKEASVMASLMKEMTEKLDIDTVQEINEIAVTLNPKTEEAEVEMIADKGKQLSKEVAVEVIKEVVEMVQEMGPVVSTREFKMIERMAKKMDPELTKKDIKTLCQIARIMDTKMGEGEVELLAMMTHASDDKTEGQTLTMQDSEHLSDMIKSMGHISKSDQKKIEEMVLESEPSIPDEKLEVVSQMLKELAPVIEPEVVMEVSNTVAEMEEGSLSDEDVEILADMTSKLSGQVSVEAVDLVAEMTEEMGPRLSRGEISMISRMGKNAGIDLSTRDVRIVSEIVKAMGSDLSESEKKVVAVISKVAEAKTKKPQQDKPKLKMEMKFKADNPQRRRPQPSSSFPNFATQSDKSFESNFGMKDTMNKKVPIRNREKFASFISEIRKTPSDSSSSSDSFGSKKERMKMRRPVTNRQRKPSSSNSYFAPATTTTTTTTTQTPIETPSRNKFPNFTPYPQQKPNATAELMKFLMGMEVTTPAPSAAAPEARPPTSASFTRPTTAQDSELFRSPEVPLPSGFPAVGGIPVFKAVPEQLRITEDANFMDFRFRDVPPSQTVANIMPQLADKIISLDGESGNNFMAFQMGAIPSSQQPLQNRENSYKNSAIERLRQLQAEKQSNDDDLFFDGDDLPSEMRESRNPGEMLLPDEITTKPTAPSLFYRPQAGTQKNTPFTVRPTAGTGFKNLRVVTTTTATTTRTTSKQVFTTTAYKPPVQRPRNTVVQRPSSPYRPWRKTSAGASPPNKNGNYAEQVIGSSSLKKKGLFSSDAYVNHDVELKNPFGSDFKGNSFSSPPRHPEKPAHIGQILTPQSKPVHKSHDYLDETYDYLDDGYKGISQINYPGVHDDRPIPIPISEKAINVPNFDDIKENFDVPAGNIGHSSYPKPQDNPYDYFDYEAGFGDAVFGLPTDGTFPDRPLEDEDKETDFEDMSTVFRDLPGVAYEPKIPDIYGKNEENLAKPYLKNPFGSDFVRMEVDPDRYTHNKTFGIRHVPLMIKGYPTTLSRPGSPTKTPVFKRKPMKTVRKRRRPMKDMRKPKPPMKLQPPKKDPAFAFPFNGLMKDAMENIPNAIQNLPDFMNTLVSNHVSWVSSGRSFKDGIVTSQEAKEEEEEIEEKEDEEAKER